MPDSASDTATLVNALCDQQLLGPSRVGESEYSLIETHISHILLTDKEAYKIKKPLNLGFLNFSTLDRRRFYCEEELRLNRRTAPDFYREVIAIYGTPTAPSLEAVGEVLEYAVKMVRFPEHELYNAVFQSEGSSQFPTNMELKLLALAIADFHHRAKITHTGSDRDPLEAFEHFCAENFDSLYKVPLQKDLVTTIQRLENWTQAQIASHKDLLTKRVELGKIRNCHGDLHLGNIAKLQQQDHPPIIFDCIEFDAGLRHIDILSDIAFLIMDLEDQGRADIGNLVLNYWLEESGDYAGLPLFALYKSYRAMVRAKIAGIRLMQQKPESAAFDLCYQELERYISLAHSYMQIKKGRWILTHGLSGSGKSFLSRHLLEYPCTIRMRSDTERKRYYADAANLYAPHISKGLYELLLQNSLALLQAGYNVIVDATFLQQENRDAFMQAATNHNVEIQWLDITCSPELIPLRLWERHKQGTDPSDADIAVFTKQQAQQQRAPLTPMERALATVINTDVLLQKADVLKLVFADKAPKPQDH